MEDSGALSPTAVLDRSALQFKKRNIGTPCSRRPKAPRPMVKIAQSRFAKNTPNTSAKSISFREDSPGNLSSIYDQTKDEPYISQVFNMQEKLGSGSFGTVYKVKSREDGCYYAVKVAREPFRGQFDRMRKTQEVKKHETLPPHPNLIRFYSSWEQRDFLFIQTELCDRTLRDELCNCQLIPEPQAWRYMADLLMALEHLHRHNLVHLDIRAENIFLSRGILKLGDFGLMIDLKVTNSSEAMEGDPKYMAKELMNDIFTTAADIFSAGICALEMVSEIDLPQNGLLWHLLREAQVPWEQINPISPEMREMITLMLDPDHNRRPSASELLRRIPMKTIAKQRRFRNGVICFGLRCLNLCYYLYHAVVSSVFRPFYDKICERFFPEKKDEQPETGFDTPPAAHQSSRQLIDFDQSFEDDDIFSASRSNTKHLRSMRSEFFSTPIARPNLRSPHNVATLFGKGPTPIHHNASHTSTIYGDCSDHEDELDPSTAGPKNLLDVFNSLDESD